MSNLSHYIIEDVNSLYSSIYLSEETEVDEIDAFAGDVYAFVAHSMLHEGYSASGILGFLSTASEDEILEKFGDYNENFISESTISEEYVNEQVEQLDEFVGAALRILGAGAKAAKYAKGATGLAPLSRIGAGLKGAGTALTRVAKQGPRASSVVRAGLSKVKSAAGAGLAKLKGAAGRVGDAVKGAVTKAAPAVKGALKGAAKMALPAAAGFALGRATAPKGETSPSKPKNDSAASTSRPKNDSAASTSRPSTRTTSAPTPPKAETKKPNVQSRCNGCLGKSKSKTRCCKGRKRSY